MLLRIAITFRGSVSAKTQASELWWRRVQDLTAADPGSSAWRRRHKAYATRRGTRPRGHLSALSASRSDRAQEGRGCQESRVPFVHWCRARLGALAPTMCLSIMPHAGAGAGGLNEDCPSRLGVHGPAWAAHGPVSISGEQPSSRREASFGCKLDEFGKRGGAPIGEPARLDLCTASRAGWKIRSLVVRPSRIRMLFRPMWAAVPCGCHLEAKLLNMCSEAPGASADLD